MPEEGGVLDQAGQYLDAMYVIDGVFNEIQEREREEADRRMRDLGVKN